MGTADRTFPETSSCAYSSLTMKEYLNLLSQVLTDGEERQDRTGVGTIGIFGAQARFDLRKGFPLLTTKKLHLRSIIYELLWFLRGDTNIKFLKDLGVSIIPTSLARLDRR